jgi:hypothetical protein
VTSVELVGAGAAGEGDAEGGEATPDAATATSDGDGVAAGCDGASAGLALARSVGDAVAVEAGDAAEDALGVGLIVGRTVGLGVDGAALTTIVPDIRPGWMTQ